MIAGSISGVTVVAAIVVVIVIIVCLKYQKFKKRVCQQDEESERREMNRQWSRQQMEKLLEDIRSMQESAKKDTEVFQQYMELVKEISDSYRLFSSMAMDGDVASDSEEETNEEI